MIKKRILYAKVIAGQSVAIVLGFFLVYSTTHAFPNRLNIQAAQKIVTPYFHFNNTQTPTLFIVSTDLPTNPPAGGPTPTFPPTGGPTLVPTRVPTKAPTLIPTNPPPKPTAQPAPILSGPVAPTANQAPPIRQPAESGGNLTGIEQEIVNLINQKRGGLPPLSVNAQLTEAARRESRDNSKRGSVGDCSHTGTDGSNFTTRAHDAGYSGFAYGETIGCGHQSAQAIVDAWWASQGHHDILNNGDITMIGVGWESGNFTAQTAVVGR